MRPSVNLDATGITIPEQEGSRLVEVPFGTARAQTEDALASALGSIKDRGANTECPAGPVSFTNYDGIVLNFQGDKFVGWLADGGDYVPAMARKEMAESSGGLTAVEGSSLGAEYVLGKQGEATISFLFDGPGEAARVTRLWAGVTCIYR
ncbi:MAG: hypothetical protein ACO25F_05335 [Erythrobacter sp.]